MKYYNQARENVAFISNSSNIPYNIVQGWIDSPGHHKNIIAKNQYSAVAGFYSEITD